MRERGCPARPPFSGRFEVCDSAIVAQETSSMSAKNESAFIALSIVIALQ
jgi:hypothetical protein